MTLILTAVTHETIWLLADRRLSYEGRRPKDNGRKVMILETKDGVALLGYAGLGATARRTEPSDWMSRVLRGRNVLLEPSLRTLANALQAEFPRHMRGMPAPAHVVLIPAFVGREPRLYSIEIALSPFPPKERFRHTRWVIDGSMTAPRVRVTGSGADRLYATKWKWMRGLLRMIKACDRRQVSDLAVADHLANINHEVHLWSETSTTEKSVGPSCVVAWRHRNGGVHHPRGGAHQFYTGTVRDNNNPWLPTIGSGMHIPSVVGAMLPFIRQQMEAMPGEPKELNKDEVNAVLARLPDTPDEILR